MIDQHTPLLLGSGSPRRREILQTLRIPFVVHAAQADETLLPGEQPEPYLQRVTRAKLSSVAEQAQNLTVGGVLVADTLVLLDEDILGKPNDVEHAHAMLRRLSGRAHEVRTRFVLASCSEPAQPLYEQTVVTRVFFRTLTDQEALLYAQSGEGLDKAGAYAVQGLGSFAIERVEGSYPNVVGLPSCEVVQALLATGLLTSYPR